MNIRQECHLYCTILYNSCVNLVIFFVMTLIRSLSLVRAIGSAIASGLEGLSLISPGVKVGGPVVYKIPSCVAPSHWCNEEVEGPHWWMCLSLLLWQ